MNLNRRKFFGVAAVSPIAAKEAAGKAIEAAAQAAKMEASGISLYEDSLYTGISVSDFDDDVKMRSIWDAIKDLGMPEWKKDDMWDDAKRSRTLDPDIADMKSMSLNAKLRLQWKRNYDTLLKRAYQQQDMERMKRRFFRENQDVSEY